MNLTLNRSLWKKRVNYLLFLRVMLVAKEVMVPLARMACVV